MDFKTWWYDSKSTKWQILIGTILITLVFIGCFTFLDTYQFEEWKYSDFVKSMIGILMGTVALGVITGVIIIFQSLVSMDREKNQKIFDERLQQYKDFTEKTMGFITDDIVDEKERESLKIIEKEILMIASSNTYEAWKDLYSDIKKLPTSEVEKKKIESDELEELVNDISDKSFDFVNSCRMDLEIGPISKNIIEASKSTERGEIAKKKFSVSDFKNYDEWLKQRLKKDPKITEDQKKTHKNIYDYVKSEFGEKVKFFFRNHSVAVKYNGKKFCNISLRAPGNYGLYLTLLRAKANNYEFPSIAGLGKENFRNIAGKEASNPKKGSEYYNIVNVPALNEDIQTQINLSFEMRAKNTPLLKSNHAQIDNILGLEN